MNSSSLITFIVFCAIGIGSESAIHAYLHSRKTDAVHKATPEAVSPSIRPAATGRTSTSDDKIERLKDFDATPRA